MGVLSDTKKYSIQRGIVLFQPSAENGYRDLGNAPSLNFNVEINKLIHRSSRSGLSVKDKTVVTQQDVNCGFTLDEPRSDNLELFFQSDGVTTATQTQASTQTATVTLYLGRWVRVTDGSGNPQRNITITEILGSDGSTTYTANTDYELNSKPGSIYVPLTGSGISDGESVTVTYNRAATTTKRVDAGTKRSILGHFAFWGDPPVGKIYEVYGYGTLTAEGELPMITEADWQSFNFVMEFESHADYNGTPELYETGDAVEE